MDLDRQEMETALRRWFVADQLGAEEVDRLWQAWEQLAASPGRLQALDRLFDPDHQVADGTDWWEQRQQGKPALVSPIGDVDRFCMMLTADPTVPRRPPARPHCPDELVGHWRLAEVSADERSVEPAAAVREWELGTGGRFAATGDAARSGCSWRVHRGLYWFLWLVQPHEDPEEWRIRKRDPDQLEMTPPDRTRGFQRWRRV